jgi:hypothetical protein
VRPGGNKCPRFGSFVSTWWLLKPRFGASSDLPDSFFKGSARKFTC